MPTKKHRTNVHLDYSLVDYLDSLVTKWMFSSRSQVVTRIISEYKQKEIEKKPLSLEEIQDYCQSNLKFDQLIKLNGLIWGLIEGKLIRDESFRELFEKVTKSDSGCTEADIIQYCAENNIPQETQEELRKILKLKGKKNGNSLKNQPN